MLAKTVPVLDQKSGMRRGILRRDGGGRRGRRIVKPHYVEPECDHSPTLDEMLGGRPWPILVGSIIIRRETLVAVGGFPDDFNAQHWGGEDTFIYLLVRERGEFAYVPEVLVRHRLRELARALR